MPLPKKRPRGAPKGNLNALKHGFYSRRLKINDTSGVESTNANNLPEEFAISRVLTRRLLDALDPEASTHQVASALRILCVVLTRSSPFFSAPFWLTGTSTMKSRHRLDHTRRGIEDQISFALKHVWDEIQARYPELVTTTSASRPASLPPTSDPHVPPPPTS